jgi:two-component system sensor histidine kinase RegB
VEELEGFPELAADAQLIREQTDRCRDILRDMGRAGKDDTHLRRAPLSTVVQEAAEPHEGRGIMIKYEFLSNDLMDPAQPIIQRKPEIIHGLRNLAQNAVDFASSSVWVDAEWGQDMITIRITDDGPGYPANIIGRIGDPFMKRNKKSQTARPGYEGMGLGLFIAKTLLERSGARLTFMNGAEDYQSLLPQTKGPGAIVTVTWDRSQITADMHAGPLKENQRFNPNYG